MNEQQKRLEVIIRIFADDLEEAFRKDFNEPALDITKPAGTQQVDEMMRKYLENRFALTLDNHKQVVNLLGHEVEDDAVIFYLEIDHVKRWRTVGVVNKCLLDRYDDQANLIHITAGQTLHSLRLSNAEPSGILTFEAR